MSLPLEPCVMTFGTSCEPDEAERELLFDDSGKPCLVVTYQSIIDRIAEEACRAAIKLGGDVKTHQVPGMDG